jgi:hypothetical protein
MEATIWITGLTCFGLGALVTHLEYTRKIKNLNKTHQVELRDWHHAAFQGGWDAALQSPLAVRERYDQLFNRH